LDVALLSDSSKLIVTIIVTINYLITSGIFVIIDNIFSGVN